MFLTGVRQFRLAMAMVWGRQIDPRIVELLIRDALRTLEEFGSPGADVEQLLDGPFADPVVRGEFQTRALRRTARRLVDRSPFYATRLAESGVDPATLELDAIHRIPVTTKAQLIEHQQQFLCRGSTPFLTTRTTGTTGRPAEVWLSRYEAELWPALASLAGLLRGEISPDDHMQINISSRATAAIQQNVVVCRLVGARASVLGVIPPDQSLDYLLGAGPQAPTLLATYPSYLAELVNAAERRGLHAADFRLRRIDVGGEVLSPSLAAAARQIFGAVRINDTFAMTEVLPVSGRSCAQGHLHHDLNVGLVEVIGLDTGIPAEPGELGTVVITPFYPYRECMPVFRYDTRDVVRRLPDEPLTCDLAGTPATSAVVGKAGALLHDGTALVTNRDLVEALEGLPTRPWPARFTAMTEAGRLRLRVPAASVRGLDPAAMLRPFELRGIDLDLVPMELGAAEATQLRTVRSDLRETTFAPAGV
jgi:phenylacetate-coenzyme A ligase PaaK-like adenylate-forming protein